MQKRQNLRTNPTLDPKPKPIVPEQSPASHLAPPLTWPRLSPGPASHLAPPLTWPLENPSKPSLTASILWPSVIPTRTAARTAAFIPAAGAPTFSTATRTHAGELRVGPVVGEQAVGAQVVFEAAAEPGEQRNVSQRRTTRNDLLI
ncbi:hypothetical protein EYF80_022818 [Liparis tanakae]|uniref:Uncharacterized protein n=1 Tax=Liparis tanakae TaxID=230148 RepID=A0A4Z2HMY2_9TELE|nr:hypothetical protein EYF80_022818 [Liparis tanakae]